MWKWLLPSLCGLATIAVVLSIGDVFGLGGTPWFGYWDAVMFQTAHPFVLQIDQISPGGAAASAGLRNGDRVDIRKLSVYDRGALVFQPVTTRPVHIAVDRDGRTFETRVVPTSLYQGAAAIKFWNDVVLMLGYIWALACAWLVAVRSWQTRAGRYLCLALLAFPALCVAPNDTAWPADFAPGLQFGLFAIPICALALLPLALAAEFGVASRLRTALTTLTIVLGAAAAFSYVWGSVGTLTAWVDPLPSAYSFTLNGLTVSLYVAATAAIAVAIAGIPALQRRRAAWMLLPIPASQAIGFAALTLQNAAPSWTIYMALSFTDNVLSVLAIAAVTYAVLRHRVLDFQFVVGRALAVAGVSLIILTAFTLLEWFLGTVLEDASHATGVAANAGLALVLGLSLSFIHKRVDAFVDFAFFHKRREDERALREFSKEAAYITDRAVLLERAIGSVHAHTDATAVHILLEDARDYDENDPLILALKVQHQPADPHNYATALKGDLVLPMLVRGRLVGVLLCGQRASGESYAPDEVDALAEVAHGVGTALDALDRTGGSGAREEEILTELRALRAAIEGRA